MAMQNVVKIRGSQPCTVQVFGASDDLIEIRGAVREEFGGGEKPHFLFFSDGTILRVAYDKPGIGVWSVQLVREGTAKVSIEECHDEDADPYSDVATVTGVIGEIRCWESLEPTKDEYECVLDGTDWRDYSRETLERVYAVLCNDEATR